MWDDVRKAKNFTSNNLNSNSNNLYNDVRNKPYDSFSPPKQ